MLLHPFFPDWLLILISTPSWIARSIVGLLSDSVLNIWNLVSSSLMQTPSVNWIICFDFDTLLSNSHPLLWLMVVWTRKIAPMGCIYTSAIRENPATPTSHTLLVLHQINLHHYKFLRKWEVNERLCIEEVGVDLEPLRSCPWTRCRTYHGSFS
jgi:hypothetical protein